MATRTTTDSTTAGAIPVDSAAFGRFAGLCALLAAFGGLLYAVSFVILKSAALSALFLLLGGLLTTVLLTSLYSHLRAVSASFSLWAFLLALVGQLGAVIHGATTLPTSSTRSLSLPGLPACPVPSTHAACLPLVLLASASFSLPG